MFFVLWLQLASPLSFRVTFSLCWRIFSGNSFRGNAKFWVFAYQIIPLFPLYFSVHFFPDTVVAKETILHRTNWSFTDNVWFFSLTCCDIFNIFHLSFYNTSTCGFVCFLSVFKSWYAFVNCLYTIQLKVTALFSKYYFLVIPL